MKGGFLFVRLGLAETKDPVAGLPLTALPEKFHPLEALQDAALGSKG